LHLPSCVTENSIVYELLIATNGYIEVRIGPQGRTSGFGISDGYTSGISTGTGTWIRTTLGISAGSTAYTNFVLSGMSSSDTVTLSPSSYLSGNTISTYTQTSYSCATFAPTPSPTVPAPTPRPTPRPSVLPTQTPSLLPTAPTTLPTMLPTRSPTATPTRRPTDLPTTRPTPTPTGLPTRFPTRRPTIRPTSSNSFYLNMMISGSATPRGPASFDTWMCYYCMNSTYISLPLTPAVLLMGQVYDTAYVHANGYITFGAPTVVSTSSLSASNPPFPTLAVSGMDGAIQRMRYSTDGSSYTGFYLETVGYQTGGTSLNYSRILTTEVLFSNTYVSPSA
jgi:hypothetical protein